LGASLTDRGKEQGENAAHKGLRKNTRPRAKLVKEAGDPGGMQMDKGVGASTWGGKKDNHRTKIS